MDRSQLELDIAKEMGVSRICISSRDSCWGVVFSFDGYYHTEIKHNQMIEAPKEWIVKTVSHELNQLKEITND